MKKITIKMFAFMMAFFVSQGIMAQSEVLFEEHFENKDLGTFKVEGSNGPEGKPIWAWDGGFNTVRADAFGKIEGEYESYLVSPAIQLGANNILTYDQATSFFANISDVSLAIRVDGTTQWAKIDFKVPETENMANIGEIAIAPEFEGQKVQIGFKYTSVSSSSSGIWAIGNIIVKGEKMAPAESVVLFEEMFEESLGGFFVEGYNGKDPAATIWYHSVGCAKADAYNKFDNKDFDLLENYLVSPVINLGKSDNVVNFDYVFHDYTDKGVDDQAGFVIREVNGEWEELAVPTLEVTKNFISSGDIIVPEKYNEKAVQIGFRYRAVDHETSAIWKIETVVVKGVGAPGVKSDPNISFSEGEVEVMIGQDFEEPILFNPNNVEVVFSSKKPEVATIDPVTGEVTIVGEGFTTITATSVETDKYMSASVNYVLTVKKAVEGTVLFSESFATGIGSFTIDGFNGDNNDIWSFIGDGMQADAYNKIEEPMSVYLVSPEITLGTNNTASYDYCAYFFADNVMKDEMAFVVRENGGEWEQLEIPDLFLPSTFTSSGLIEIPEKYDNKTVQVAFRYSAQSGGSSGVWIVKDLEIRGIGGVQKADPLLSFDVTEVQYNMGDEFKAPVLTNPYGVAVTYSSGDTAIADVDPNTGVVTFYNEGVVTITASSIETADFKAGEASYTVTVTVPTGIDGISADDLKNGKVFDLQGRRVYNPGKGIYIVNGKKVVIR